MGADVADWQRALLSDPQTSGGLLIACDPSVENEVLAAFLQHGFAAAKAIGHLGAGAPRVQVSVS